MDVIQVEDLKLYYNSEAGITKAVDGVTLEITGPSGSGKSSLIQMIGGAQKTYFWSNQCEWNRSFYLQ